MYANNLTDSFENTFSRVHDYINSYFSSDDSWKYFDIEIDTMIVIIQYLLIISLITIILILIFKIYVETESNHIIKRSKELKFIINNLIENKIFNTNAIANPKTKLGHFALVNVIIYFIRKYPEYKSFFYEILEKKGSMKYLQERSNDAFSFSRFESVEKLGLLNYEKNKVFLFKIIVNSGNKRLIEHAMIGISSIIERKDLKYILNELVKLKGSGKFFEFIFSTLIQRMLYLKEKQGIIDIFYFLLEVRNNEKYLKPFIDAVGYIKVNDCSSEFFDLYFMAHSLDLKMSTIRAIGALSINEKSDEAIMFALSSKKDVLRIAASKNLNLYNFEKYKSKIEELLADSNYNVRLNTALSVANSEDGLSLLNKIYEESDDLYAKEMAKYAIVVNERRNKNIPILKNWELEEKFEAELEVLKKEENISDEII
jgi:hypothetical protein